ncbi:ABC transporter substrate-binding protein [Cohnella sp. GbtcB17]|uniref:ABC transporter substrate-binding protein n=1 Tax=Cohnella sp. GbtcB17 TaxID=2824762 RepID=UPI001C30DC86|nr:ABC transporter substrate-binding protein [Cohnella sp. GbtcB17]
MTRRIEGYSLRLAVLLLFVLTAGGCGISRNGASNEAGEIATASPSDRTVHVFNFKVEMAEQLNALAKQYEQETGVRIAVDTCGGGCDYSAALKTRFNSGDKPDLFFVAGYTDLDLWQEYLEDLSDQPWVSDLVDLTKPGITKDGKVYGMPLVIEGWGFIYNKQLFRQAGIAEPPVTLEALREAAKKLQAAGIQPFENAYAEWWIVGNHLLNLAFAAQPHPFEFVEAVKRGDASLTDNAILNQWTDLVDLTVAYGQPDSLQTDYNAQMANFAAGRAAMMQQGIWTQLQLDEMNPNLDIGFLPMPINNDASAMDKLQVGVPNYWVVYKNSGVKQEAKAFMNWIATSAAGRQFFMDAKLIPPFRSIPIGKGQLGPLADDVIAYLKAGKTLPWMWQRYPGYEANTSRMAVQIKAYIGKQIDRERMYREFQRIWRELS